MAGYKIGPNTARKLASLIGGGEVKSSPPSSRSSYRDSSFSKVSLAQAPSGGIPARSGKTPGSAICTQVIVAPTAGTGYAIGDLVKTAKTFTVKNWTFDVAASAGDRVCQVEGHRDNAMVVGWSCVNAGTASDIILFGT